MKPPLHILHLEDNPNDAVLIHSALEDGGLVCELTVVQTRGDFVAALERGGIDLILSDYALPSFDGLSALEIVHKRWPAIPYIILSGTMGEEQAIDSLKSGAADYVLKQRLSRLVPAVRRALAETSERETRRQLEARLIEGQKMEVIGQLASGVAHDFNNILAVVMGYSEMLLLDLGPANALRGQVEEIRLAAQRAVGLTRQLLVFSCKETVQAVVLDFNEVVKGLDQMLRRLVGENIEMKIVAGDDTGRIKADSGYIGQVLMNLVVNARDAMPHGGRLTIATSRVTFDESTARRHSGMTAGTYVRLTVSDTGTGMTDEVKEHLFEAFFTTKPKGEGTGLGMATCQTIIQLSGGHIEVHSELGAGTTFEIYFPQVDEPLKVTAMTSMPWPLPTGSETLLVVEDEPAVRHLAHAILQAQGYHVLLAVNGQDGLRVSREHKGSPISLVVTDVIMPVMGGKVMVEWLKTEDPELKILFTSGYMDDVVPRTGVVETGVEYLPKPYTPTSLTRKVREMLDNGNRSASVRADDGGWGKKLPATA